MIRNKKKTEITTKIQKLHSAPPQNLVRIKEGKNIGNIRYNKHKENNVNIK